MTRAGLNIAWCEEHLHLPEGRFVGQPLVMAEFMQDDFRAIYEYLKAVPCNPGPGIEGAPSSQNTCD